MNALLRAGSMMVLLAGIVSWSGASLANDKAGCDRSATPPKVDGQVVQVDRSSGKVTLRGADGKTYEFRASNETLKDLTVGDRIEANLRSMPNC